MAEGPLAREVINTYTPEGAKKLGYRCWSIAGISCFLEKILQRCQCPKATNIDTVCVTNIYTYQDSDGNRVRVRDSILCEDSSLHTLCAREYYYKHSAVRHVNALHNNPLSHSRVPQLHHVAKHIPDSSVSAGSYDFGTKPSSLHRRCLSGREGSAYVYSGSGELSDRTYHGPQLDPSYYGRSISTYEWPASETSPRNDIYIDTSQDATDQRPMVVDEKTSQSKRRVHFKLPNQHYSDSKAFRVEHDSYGGRSSSRCRGDEMRQQQFHDRITGVDTKAAECNNAVAPHMLHNQRPAPIPDRVGHFNSKSSGTRPYTTGAWRRCHSGSFA
ncbi:hypothetical protein FSARC_11951 [Fusarium sarcochroum]|uniref:Uncharacterized protein n=1 Tax=Fusarium sarcochroum TaxID=1208366 RepID=A0A8H4TBV2_9HYPO|nr:hypothetical protein FSARC_11951 [Fusarium sarcochroum]